MAKYAGRKGRVLIAATSGGTAVEVSLSEWSIDMTSDRFDVTSFGATNKQYVQGLPDLTGSLSGFWDNADTTLFLAARASGPVAMYLYPSTDAAGIFWSGLAYVDASISVPVGGAISISGSFAAADSWSQDLT